GRRNCPIASAIDHSASASETACLYQDGPHPPRVSGQDRSHLEAGTVHCPARDAAALASPGFQALLEVLVQGHFSHAKDLPGDGGLDRRRWPETTACGEQNASGANSSSWASTSAN